MSMLGVPAATALRVGVRKSSASASEVFAVRAHRHAANASLRHRPLATLSGAHICPLASRGRPALTWPHPPTASAAAHGSRCCPSGSSTRQKVSTPSERSPLEGTDEELDEWAMAEDVHLHIHSRFTSEPYQQSEFRVPGDKEAEPPHGWDVRLVSAAGMKGAPTSPNQDAYSYTHLANGWTILLACDGHGDAGEVISERVARTIPLLFSKQLAEAAEVEEALKLAFLGAQSDLEACCRTDQVYSGTTVVLCCFHLERKEIWFAHTGDSRTMLGDLSDAKVVFCTEDHKAHDPDENKRLKDKGAQVIQKRYEDGETVSRVFIPRTGVPGLAMSRSLGDGCLKKYGVTAEPEVKNLSGLWDKCEAPIIVAASDGLWDAISVDDTMKALSARHRSKLDVRLGAEILTRRAQRLWIEAEGDYCDDVTVLIMAPHTATNDAPPVAAD